MRHLVLFAVACTAIVGAARAEDTVSVRVSAPPCGRFYVDGKLYQTSQTFLWARNSTHTLGSAKTYFISNDIQCVANQSWADDNGQVTLAGPNPTIFVTGPASYSQEWSYSYRIAVMLSGGGSIPAFDCNGTAFVEVNGACYDRNKFLWEAPGTTMNVSLRPPSGFSFLGWDDPRLGNSASLSFTLTGPIVLHPKWTPAAHFTVYSDPPGMKVLVDQTPRVTPVSVEWAPKSQHGLAPLTPQEITPGGKQWAFMSWSDNGPENRIVTAPGSGAWSELTVKYALASMCTFGTTPTGLSLTIDGRTNWPGYTFLWGLGSKHRISAPLEQSDASGRKYTFKNWTIGGPAEQDYTVVVGPHPVANAVYEIQGRLLIQSSTPNALVLVDGAPCSTPCSVSRPPGVQVRLSAPNTIGMDDNERLGFEGWSDGGPADRVWTATAQDQTLMAKFGTKYRVLALSDPAGGAKFHYNPSSEDGFFPINSYVSVTAEPKPGYTFRTWDGDVQLSPTIQVRVYAPQSVLAILDTYPYIEGVFNAAGETPEPNVAPGSIIAVRGANLSPTTTNGPANPLAQTISGVNVQVNGRKLPLFSVAPAEITAQLPSDLAAGAYTLVVHQERREDVKAKFTVKRNAPGLFGTNTGEESFALAMHEDGTQVTAAKPAARGEIVILLGTGFGPALPAPPDGKILPLEPKTAKYPLMDPVMIRSGEKTVIQPLSAEAAKGYIGTVAVRVKIPADTPPGTLIELRAAVKDPVETTGKTFHESNKVLVPLKP